MALRITAVNLFFLDFGDETIKAEFTYFPFPRIEKGKPQYGIDIDSITDIAVNKLFSIYQRSAARDYIDLYLICLRHDFSIDRLIKLAKAKFDWHIEPIQLASQFLKSEQAADYPRMVIEINHGDWQKFFRAEAKKIKPEILEWAAAICELPVDNLHRLQAEQKAREQGLIE